MIDGGVLLTAHECSQLGHSDTETSVEDLQSKQAGSRCVRFPVVCQWRQNNIRIYAAGSGSGNTVSPPYRTPYH